MRLARVLAALSVNMKQTLGLGVIGLEVCVLERPCGRNAVLVLKFVEVALTTEMTGEMTSLLDQRAPVTNAAMK